MSKRKIKARKLGPKPKGRLFLTAILAVLLSFGLAILVMRITGVEDKNFFKALLRTMTGLDLGKVGTKHFFRPRFIGEYLQIAMPLILSGLSVGFANRCGLFNIGSEGQLIMGMLGANLAALTLGYEGPGLWLICLLASAVFGALWALIPGLLKAYYGVHEVVTTIMFNYAGLHLANFALKAIPGGNPSRTRDLPQTALLESAWLRELTGNSRFHWGFVVVLLGVLSYMLLINRSRFGFELRAVGFNRDAAECSGIAPKSRVVWSMLIAGAYAGLGGAMLTLGTFSYGRVLMGFESYGFDGIAVALLGGATGVGIFFSGLLMAGLRSGQALMQAMRVPLEIAQIVSATIIVFVAMQHGIEALLTRIFLRRGKRG